LGQSVVDAITGGCTGYDSRNGATSGSDYHVGCGQYFFPAQCWGNCIFNNTCWTATTTTTQTSDSYTMTGGNCVATYTTSLSIENTTDDLKTNTVGLLPDFPTTFTYTDTGICAVTLANANLASNELNYSVQESQYFLAHPVPPTGGSYSISWIERFTPASGGAAVDTTRTYTWDGTTPSGYSVSDPSTWPKTSTYTVNYPTSNGTVKIVNLQYTCNDSTTTVC
jgi:hypothetical protein